MRTVRKWLAFMLAVGLMVSAVTVFASGGSYSYTSAPSGTDFMNYDYSQGGLIENLTNGGVVYRGLYVPADAKVGCEWMNMNEDEKIDGYNYSYIFDGTRWYNSYNDVVYSGKGLGGSSGSESSSSKRKSDDGPRPLTDQDIKDIQTQAEAEAVQHAASDEGFADVGDMYRAAEHNMSAGEFYNNAVVSTPGIENAVTVGQGGNLVVNGQVTNMSATITKVTNRAYVDSVRIEREGRVLNVVDVSYPAVEATINFYMPGITGEESIAALQYNAGRWVEIEVAEVRADHVTLNMKGNGVVAFIAQ